MDNYLDDIYNGLIRYVGQTVTIFTVSGGLSGSGFTGVLISVDCNVVRLLVAMGAPPACPVSSDCYTPYGCNGNGYGNPLGAIAVIPIRVIAAFVHNTI